MPRYFYLTPVLGGPGAPRFPVTDDLQLIGRSEKAHISLLEPTVSRRHATVQCKDGKISLADLGSKHGTFVNSRRVNTTDLRVGDIVVFGLSLVLRLEETTDPVPPQDALALPTDTPTLLDPLERLTITDPQPLGRSQMRQPTGLGLMAPEEKTAVNIDASAICGAMLPEAHVRLTELRADLRRLVDEGVDETDPYPILASVESVLATLNPIMQALGNDESFPSPSIVRLREVVERVIERIGSSLASRGVRFLSEVERGFKVQGDVRRLEGALALLLRCAGMASPDRSPVELMATTAGGDRVRLSISHLGQEYPPDILRRGGRGGDPIARDVSEASRLVRGIGGEISVESRPGVGSTVRVTLPMPGRASQR